MIRDPVDRIEIHCLNKPKVGPGTILADTFMHLPDILSFSLTNIIDDPLEVIRLKRERCGVPLYQSIVTGKV